MVARLSELGVNEDGKNFKNKIGKGEFIAAFLLATLEAIGPRPVQIDVES